MTYQQAGDKNIDTDEMLMPKNTISKRYFVRYVV